MKPAPTMAVKAPSFSRQCIWSGSKPKTKSWNARLYLYLANKPGKRFDLAVKACTRLNFPLSVIGDGPDNKRLRKMAGPSITFTEYSFGQSAGRREFASAQALIFPGLDDFGITPVEAMASGTPVIAYQAGGALDYVVPHRTGLFFARQTSDALEEVLKFDASKYSAPAIAVHAPEILGRKLPRTVH